MAVVAAAAGVHFQGDMPTPSFGPRKLAAAAVAAGEQEPP